MLIHNLCCKGIEVVLCNIDIVEVLLNFGIFYVRKTLPLVDITVCRRLIFRGDICDKRSRKMSCKNQKPLERYFSNFGVTLKKLSSERSSVFQRLPGSTEEQRPLFEQSFKSIRTGLNEKSKNLNRKRSQRFG